MKDIKPDSPIELDGIKPISYGISRMFSVFVLGAGQTTLLICLPVIMEETAIGYGLLSVMVALGTGLFILSAPAWGKMSDRYGRKPVVLAGLIGVSVSFGLIALSVYMLALEIISQKQALMTLFSARVVYGLMASGLYPAVQAWAIDDDPENCPKSLSRITASINGGRLLGPLIPVLLTQWGSTYPLAFIAIMGFLLCLWIIVLPARKRVSQGKHQAERQLFWKLLSDVWPFLLLACSVTISFGFLQYVIGPKLFSFFHDGTETSQTLSWLMMLVALATIVTHFLCSGWVQKQLSMALRLGSSLLLIGVLLVMCSNSLLWLAIGLVISGASVTLLTPAYTTIASTQARQQGLLTGALSMIHTIGYTAGALLAGIAAGKNDWIIVMIGAVAATTGLIITFLCIDVEEKAVEKSYVGN